METTSNTKRTVVLGASPNPERYSFMAVNRLKSKGHPVVAIGSRAADIGDTPIITTPPAVEDVDTVTLYLNPARQQQYYDYILQLKPRRIIFNPGAENTELENIARKNNIEPVNACTLVLLSTGQF
ncbi:CoA-binding protein [Chitinophaga sp. Mgbs1]|uniref:CoA-binding protein n=1 Tax=Chitinophaga solisilvae TaxID=1233460 RepID=A0A433WC30_9BACT|nr:CoA-binding protein [Chitinophaga solisilvae]